MRRARLYVRTLIASGDKSKSKKRSKKCKTLEPQLSATLLYACVHANDTRGFFRSPGIRAGRTRILSPLLRQLQRLLPLHTTTTCFNTTTTTTTTTAAAVTTVPTACSAGGQSVVVCAVRRPRRSAFKGDHCARRSRPRTS